MLKALFTLDYEIHGNGDGCPYRLMIEPTRRMMDVFDEYGAKLTIMADVAEILKFREYREQSGRDDFRYDEIAEQLRDAIRRGHDVQLHLHASYFNARYENGRWLQDWSEYNFAGLSAERLHQVVQIGKRFLEDLLKPVNPEYGCIAFRAANWAVSPSREVVRALVNHGILIETSVFKYGRRQGVVSFDYSGAHSDLVPWPVQENDINQKCEGGKLVEFPIYCEKRWIGPFLTPNRVYRAIQSRLHRLGSNGGTGYGGSSTGAGKRSGALGKLSMITRRHAWKADFNQCTGHQLVRALNRADQKYTSIQDDLPFVLIGHSKLFTRANERSLRPFLGYVARNASRFGFAKFGDFAPHGSVSVRPGAAPDRQCALPVGN